MNLRIAKLIRILTLPQLMVIWTVILLHREIGADFRALMIVLFLTVLPLLSYPLCAITPRLRAGGRKTQRNMAVAFSVAGYFAGLLYALFCGGSTMEVFIYLCYICSGVLIAVGTALGCRASGHMAGMAGPVVMLSLIKSPWFALVGILMLPIAYSSLKLRRHTMPELILGALSSAVPVVIFRFWMLL